jgi:Arc/MetJ-type ribon-helix-helix transcriptional regulator
MSEYRTISIKQELIREIEEMLETGRYRSISEFVSEAVRLRLEELVHAEAARVGKGKEILGIKDGGMKEIPKFKVEASGIQYMALKTVQETPLQIQLKEMEQKEPRKAQGLQQ